MGIAQFSTTALGPHQNVPVFDTDLAPSKPFLCYLLYSYHLTLPYRTRFYNDQLSRPVLCAAYKHELGTEPRLAFTPCNYHDLPSSTTNYSG